MDTVLPLGSRETLEPQLVYEYPDPPVDDLTQDSVEEIMVAGVKVGNRVSFLKQRLEVEVPVGTSRRLEPLENSAQLAERGNKVFKAVKAAFKDLSNR